MPSASGMNAVSKGLLSISRFFSGCSRSRPPMHSRADPFFRNENPALPLKYTEDFISRPRKLQKFAAPIERGNQGFGFSISHNIPNWLFRSYWLVTVESVISKFRLAWGFGIPQIPFPPLTET